MYNYYIDSIVIQKKKEAQIANQIVNNPLYQPVVQPTTSSNNVSLDLGQAEAQRQAEEARKQQEKKKRDLYNKACTDLLNGQRYAQELAAIYQKEQNDYVYYIAQFPSIDWLTEDERKQYQYSDFLQPFTESQKIKLIVIGRERSITMDDIRRLDIDESLTNQGIMDFFNTSLRGNRLGLSVADLDQQFNSYAKAQRSQLLGFAGMAAAMAWVASYNASGLSYSNVSESQFTRFNFNETNSKYNIEGTRGTVDDFIKANVNPNFQQNVKNAFTSDAKATTLTKDLTVYRYHGGTSSGKSYWYTPNLTSNPAADLALPAGNTYQYVDTYIIPKGTTILEGTVAPNFGQPGGGYQIYVPNPTVVIPK